MKKTTIIVILLFLAISAYAVPGWLIGFGVGVGVQVVPWTRNHIIMPPLLATKHKIQQTVRPLHPQDDIAKQERKAAKIRRRQAREARKARSKVSP